MKELIEKYIELIPEDKREKYSHSGIYCIKLGDKIVYIGKSLNMLERIAGHMAEIENNCPKSNKYKVLHEAHINGINISFDVMYYTKSKIREFVIEDIGEAEGRYIRQYTPVLNYQIPKIEDWHRFTTNKTAQTIKLKDIMVA